MKVIVVNAFSNESGSYAKGDVVDLGQEYIDAGWAKPFEDVKFVQTTIDDVQNDPSLDVAKRLLTIVDSESKTDAPVETPAKPAYSSLPSFKK